MIKIRNLKKEDAPQVAELIKQLTQNIKEPENLINRIKEMSEPQSYEYFVAEKDSQIIGFAGLVWYPVPSKGLIGWIEEVVVDEKLRGQGIGKLLMERLLNLALEKECQQVKLTALNPIAKKLYESLGFDKKDHIYFNKDLTKL